MKFKMIICLLVIISLLINTQINNGMIKADNFAEDGFGPLIDGSLDDNLNSSRAENGVNILPHNLAWTSFSVRDDLHNGGVKTDWENNILKEIEDEKKEALEDFRNGLISEEEYSAKCIEADGLQSYTEGWISDGENTPSDVSLWCKNTGWDGKYEKIDTVYGKKMLLVDDNPWGLTCTMDKIPVEYGRYYTMEFDISSDLTAMNLETGSREASDKYCLVKVYDYQSKGEPTAVFESFKVNGKETAIDGKFKISKTPTGDSGVVTHITATFKIPNTKDEWSGGKDIGAFTNMGIKFALGSFLKTHNNEVEAGGVQSWEEIALRGYVHIKNLKVLAGTQYAVTYYDGAKICKIQYVNENEYAKSISIKKEGYKLNGFVDIDSGEKYSFDRPVRTNIRLIADWIKEREPATKNNNNASNSRKNYISKVKIKKAKSPKKKRLYVKWKKLKGVSGYQFLFSPKKKFDSMTYKRNYKQKVDHFTVIGLKRKKTLYVKGRAFKKVKGTKVFGPWSSVKKVKIK